LEAVQESPAPALGAHWNWLSQNSPAWQSESPEQPTSQAEPLELQVTPPGQGPTGPAVQLPSPAQLPAWVRMLPVQDWDTPHAVVAAG
jgi:hypothetical protein